MDTVNDFNATSQPTAQPVPAPSMPTAGQPPVAAQPAPAPNTQGLQPTGPKAPAMPAQPQPEHPRSRAVNALLNLGQELAGGPNRTVNVDQDGNRTVEYRPLSGRQVGLSILAHALAGALAGSQAKGPNATVQALGMGAATSMKLNEQAEAKTDAEAEEEAKAMLRKRQMVETASRVALNTQQAEKYQREGIQAQIASDQYLAQDAESNPDDVIARNLTQDEILANMGPGKKYDPVEMVPVATGMREVQQPDGSNRLETVFSLIKDPDKEIQVSPAQIAKWNAAGMDVKVAPGTTLTLSRRAYNSVSQLALAHSLTDNELSTMRDLLKEQPAMLKALPAKLDWQPGLALAVRQAQRYPGRDIAEQIAAMHQSRDPKAAGYAATLEQAFGGATVINAAHQELLDQEAARTTAANAAAKETPTEKALKQAQTKKALADAAKADADRKLGITSNLTGDAFIKTLPPADQALVRQIGSGQLDLGRLSYLAAKNPQLLSAVTQAFPDFDTSKVSSYVQTRKDFTSGKTSIALNSGATALQHLRDLKAINDAHPVEVRTPGTAAYNSYHNLLNTVTGELSQFYQLPKTDKSIEAMEASLDALANRDASILRQAKSMGEKMDSYEQTWKNAAPSAAYQQPMPGISETAKQARASLDPEYAQRIGSQRVVPKNAKPAYANGKLVGYMGADGKYVSF